MDLLSVSNTDTAALLAVSPLATNNITVQPPGEVRGQPEHRVAAVVRVVEARAVPDRRPHVAGGVHGHAGGRPDPALATGRHLVTGGGTAAGDRCGGDVPDVVTAVPEQPPE